MSKPTEEDECPYCAGHVKIRDGRPVLTHLPNCRGVELHEGVAPVEIEMPCVEHRISISLQGLNRSVSLACKHGIHEMEWCYKCEEEDKDADE